MIRARLTRAVVISAAVVLAGFAASVFWTTRVGLLAEVERDLTTRAEALAAAIERDPTGATRPSNIANFGAPDVIAVVYDPTGRLVAESGTLSARRPELNQVLAAGDGVNEIDVDGPLYVTALPVEPAVGDNGSDGLVVVVGRSPDRLYEALGRLAVVLIPATILALGAIGLSVYLSIRRALRPLEDLNHEAGTVAASGDHRLRITGHYHDDEVGALARTLDSMLVSLDAEHARAKEATEIQRQFLADVSHQLRGPLAVVTSSVELAGRVADDEPELHDRLLRDAGTELARMARIVTQLLMMARTGAEDRAADRPLLIADLVMASAERWGMTADGVDVDVSDLAPITDAVVEANADHLSQVFDVLLDNAVKFTPAGGRIDIDGALVDGHVVIRVSDTGVGIPPDDLERVFDRFHRGERQPVGAGDCLSSESTGLGLSIARHVVEAHGGLVFATNRPGGGTTITVKLPTMTERRDQLLPA